MDLQGDIEEEWQWCISNLNATILFTMEDEIMWSKINPLECIQKK